MNNGGQAHRSTPLSSNRQGSSHSIKKKKRKDSDFYAIDIFIVTQKTFSKHFLGQSPSWGPSRVLYIDKALEKGTEMMTTVGSPDIVMIFPNTVCFTWQEGKERYKAVLFSTLLLSLNAEQILTHSTYATTNRGRLKPAGLWCTVLKRLILTNLLG